MHDLSPGFVTRLSLNGITSGHVTVYLSGIYARLWGLWGSFFSFKFLINPLESSNSAIKVFMSWVLAISYKRDKTLTLRSKLRPKCYVPQLCDESNTNLALINKM